MNFLIALIVIAFIVAGLFPSKREEKKPRRKPRKKPASNGTVTIPRAEYDKLKENKS